MTAVPTPIYRSLKEVQANLKNGNIRCVTLVERYLSQIEQHQHLNAFIEVFADEARQKAAAIDKKLAEDPNSLGRLFGIVLSIKDLLCYKDHQVTGASKILEGFTSLYSATAVGRLLQQDAIIIGRVNCDEFGMGSTNEHSAYGPVRNALDTDKVAGGSSGGSAVSVQTDCCLASIGSDTGGSVRQPASLCGLIGLKPSYGRISRHGLLAYASSFDQIGTITHCVEDAGLLLEVMAGADEYDPGCSQRPVGDYRPSEIKGQQHRVAWFDQAIDHQQLDVSIKSAFRESMSWLQRQGHTAEPVDFDYLDYLVPTYYILTTAEASSNLSRYDGMRYGYRSENSLTENYRATRTEGFGVEVKRRIMLGTFVLSSGYYEAYFAKAQQVRRLINDFMDQLFETYDYLVLPATAEAAWPIGRDSTDPVKAYLADIYTVLANLAGIPAISLPLGRDEDGMPFGIQIMARKFEEQKLLEFAAFFEGFNKG